MNNIARYIDSNLLCNDIISGALPLTEALNLTAAFRQTERTDFLAKLHSQTRTTFRRQPTPALQRLLDDITEEELDTCA